MTAITLNIHNSPEENWFLIKVPPEEELEHARKQAVQEAMSTVHGLLISYAGKEKVISDITLRGDHFIKQAGVMFDSWKTELIENQKWIVIHKDLVEKPTLAQLNATMSVIETFLNSRPAQKKPSPVINFIANVFKFL